MNSGDSQAMWGLEMKIRYKTWYYGKWVLEGQHGFSLRLEGFERYVEAVHGWHLFEEFRSKNGK